MSHPRRHVVPVVALIALGSCSSPNKPTPPTPDPPTLTCPAPVSLVSTDGMRVPYLFALPTPVSGQPPVTVSCVGAQAAGYPVGTSNVTCTATDALSRQGSCSFSITVTVTPKISKTKFLAFGDSITFGRCGPKLPEPNTCPPYTVRLDELLRARYTSQSFLVATSGLPGEKATEGTQRIASAIDAYGPEVLLLMEGTNDVLNDPFRLDQANDAIEDMITIARNRGVTTIFLATIPPIRPGGSNNAAVPRVTEMNNEIRDIAAKMGAHLVDVFGALNADLARYYPVDDVHPTGEGLRLIGETFYAAIREKLDITPGGAGLLKR
jgi:lysophospholipase L1-like esterase